MISALLQRRVALANSTRIQSVLLFPSKPSASLRATKRPFFSAVSSGLPKFLSLSEDAIACQSAGIHSRRNELSARYTANQVFRHRLQLASLSAPTGRGMSTSSAMASDSSSTPIDDDGDFVWARRKGMRCIAIVAHVDHGKTSLVDQLLRAADEAAAVASGNLDSEDSGVDRLLDSGDLEKERGITITSKVTRIRYVPTSTDADESSVTINIADSPGHADFSAEVDRILSVTDGFLLVVDAVEGPKSQTKYVLSRALALNLKPIVVLNKCDRPEASVKIDSGETEARIHDLFVALGASEEQLHYTTLYASAREGWVTKDPLQALELAESYRSSTASWDDDCHMRHLLDTVIHDIPEPLIRRYDLAHLDPATEANSSYSAEAFYQDKFSLAAVSVGYDPFLGRTCSGRIISGSVGVNDSVMVLRRSGETSPSTPTRNISGVFVYQGIRRVSLMEYSNDQRACAGDYVTLAGVPDSIAVGDTVTGSTNPVPEPIQTPLLAPPTLSMDFGNNDGPLSGQEGTILAASQIRDRLFSETDNNVTLKVEQHPTETEKTVVLARGELQLGILVEQMRREGYELVISPPRILTKKCASTGKTFEPYEEVIVDVDSEYTGAVVNILTERKGTVVSMSAGETNDGKSQLVFEMPSRGMLGGFRSELATATRGSAVVNHIYIGDREEVSSNTALDQKGKLVSNELGKASAYALSSLEARGTLFVGPGDLVYPGMVIGENSKAGDMEVNPVRSKEKTNMRTKAKDETVQLATPKRMTVEELIAYMSPDEMIEITPKSVRLRKQLLDSGARERAARNKAKQLRDLKEKRK